jgi:hypothetical protein
VVREGEVTIYKEDKKGRSRGIYYDFTDKVLDPHIERLGEFFVKRMPADECRFETFIERPEWAWSIYSRSGKAFDKALIAGSGEKGGGRNETYFENRTGLAMRYPGKIKPEEMKGDT